MERVAILILNFKSWEETLAEVEHCHEFLNIDYGDIIVVDNASPNNSAEMLRKNSKDKFIFIESDNNSGYAAGNNIGLRYAYQHGYRYVWILNNDIIIDDRDILKKLLNVFSVDSKVAIVNPDIYSLDGYLFNRDAVKPKFWDYTLGMLMYRKKGRIIEDKGGYGYVYRPQGCCMLVDCTKLALVDFLDENTFLYVEEPIIAERLLKKDMFCACCFNTRIIHNHSKTVKSSIDSKRIRTIHNQSFSYYLREYRRYSAIKIKICCWFNSIKMILLG